MLHYTRYKKENSPTLVFIHGFLGSELIYSQIIPKLSETYDIMSIDLAGHGSSAHITVAPTIDAYAQQVAYTLRRENINNSIWITHAMGGYIALAAIEKNFYPMKALVLAYSSSENDQPSMKEMRNHYMNKIRYEGSAALVDEIIPSYFSENTNSQLIQFTKYIGYKASPIGLMNALAAMKMRRSQQTLIDCLSIPTLVINGDVDQIVTPIQTSNPNVNIQTTSTGHLGMLESPEQFIEHLQTFLAPLTHSTPTH